MIRGPSTVWARRLTEQLTFQPRTLPTCGLSAKIKINRTTHDPPWSWTNGRGRGLMDVVVVGHGGGLLLKCALDHTSKLTREVWVIFMWGIRGGSSNVTIWVSAWFFCKANVNLQIPSLFNWLFELVDLRIILKSENKIQMISVNVILIPQIIVQSNFKIFNIIFVMGDLLVI